MQWQGPPHERDGWKSNFGGDFQSNRIRAPETKVVGRVSALKNALPGICVHAKTMIIGFISKMNVMHLTQSNETESIIQSKRLSQRQQRHGAAKLEFFCSTLFEMKTIFCGAYNTGYEAVLRWCACCAHTVVDAQSVEKEFFVCLCFASFAPFIFRFQVAREQSQKWRMWNCARFVTTLSSHSHTHTRTLTMCRHMSLPSNLHGSCVYTSKPLIALSPRMKLSSGY